MDMFCNSSIVYHVESILEMQVMMIVVVYYLNYIWKDKRFYDHNHQVENVNLTDVTQIQKT